MKKKRNAVKEAAEATAKPCPSCGYCAQCGRSNRLQFAPHVVPYIYPYTNPHYPTWTVTSGTNFSTQAGTDSTQASLGGYSVTLGNLQTGDLNVQ